MDKLDWVEVSCFDNRVLAYLNHIAPQIRLHKLIEEKKALHAFLEHDLFSTVSYLDIEVNLRKEVYGLDLLSKNKIIFWTVTSEDLSREINAGLYGMMLNNIC